jgi:hypothetical protein
MGLLDKLKGLLKGNADKVKDGVDKAGDMIDDKTGGKFGDKIEMAEDKVGEMIDKVDDAAEETTEG